MRKGKYNPNGICLFKGKVVAQAGYRKGTFLNDSGLNTISDIVQNGGYVEIKKQGRLDTGAEFMEVKIYFIPD